MGFSEVSRTPHNQISSYFSGFHNGPEVFIRQGESLISDEAFILAVPMCVLHGVRTKRVNCSPSYGRLMVQRNGQTSGQKREEALG